jgi:hypothetical protein
MDVSVYETGRRYQPFDIYHFGPFWRRSVSGFKDLAALDHDGR